MTSDFLLREPVDLKQDCILTSCAVFESNRKWICKSSALKWKLMLCQEKIWPRGNIWMENNKGPKDRALRYSIGKMGGGSPQWPHIIFCKRNWFKPIPNMPTQCLNCWVKITKAAVRSKSKKQMFGHCPLLKGNHYRCCLSAVTSPKTWLKLICLLPFIWSMSCPAIRFFQDRCQEGRFWQKTDVL